MFDLHQGFTHEDRKDQRATGADVALALIDAAAALGKGRLRIFAMQQARAARLLAELADRLQPARRS